MDVGKKIKKTPIVVGNCNGFAVNHMFFPYSQSALLLTDLGLDVHRIDKVITSFGMPMGPFRLCDLVEFEVAVTTGMQIGIPNLQQRAIKALESVSVSWSNAVTDAGVIIELSKFL